MEMTIVSKWANQQLAPSKRNLNLNPKIMDFWNSCWPVHMEYKSPIPLLVLSAVENMTQLNLEKQWIVRDGILPLLAFFQKNSEPPKNLKTKLYVSETVAEIIPTAWRNCFGLRKLSTLQREAPVHNLILTGLMSKNYVNLSTVTTQIEKLKAEKKNKGFKTLSIFTPPRYFGYGAEHDHEFIYAYAEKIISNLGTANKIYEWLSFQTEQSFSGFQAVDLNSEFLVSDSYLLHHMYARGASAQETHSSSAEVISLSPFYGWKLISQLPKQKQHEVWTRISEVEEYQRYLEKMEIEKINNRFPWGDWLNDWSQRRQP